MSLPNSATQISASGAGTGAGAARARGRGGVRQWLKRQVPAPILRWRWSAYCWRQFNGEGEAELKILENLCPRGRGAVDVGGGVGVYSFHLSRFAARVHTFEPNPNYAWRIEKMGLANVTVARVALSDHEGEAVLRVPNDTRFEGQASLEPGLVAYRPDHREIAAPVRTLDSYGLKDVGFIKIDVEGHEEKVLAGASALIARDKPALLIEIEETHNPGGLARVAARLAPLGYEGWFVAAERLRPISAFDPEKQCDRDDPAQTYVFNFLFLQPAV